MNFEDVLRELIEENPFAARTVLKLLQVRYTDEVPTLAVTCRARPELLVNLAFIDAHCSTENHIKALLCHEFLHVLLRHTEDLGPYDPAQHLAFDAVINAIIHRQFGVSYSSMMSLYYGESSYPMTLLRPPSDLEAARKGFQQNLWNSLYAGTLVADDIAALARDLKWSGPTRLFGPWLGNHSELGDSLDELLAEALNKSLREMNGTGIWRSPKNRGVGGNLYQALILGQAPGRRDWERDLVKLLKKHLAPDKAARSKEDRPIDYLLPVLSGSDRRAFVRSLWSPFLPEARWAGAKAAPAGSAQLYLDVSGSMNAEMAALVGLLDRVQRYIRRPFWAFSDEVSPAVIEDGILRTSTTGGTSLQAVLAHLAKTKPEAAVIVTDGYIEAISRQDLERCRGTRIHVLISANGKPDLLKAAGIAWTKLKELPT